MRFRSLAILALWAFAAPSALAQRDAIDDEVQRLLPRITELRHQIHENPELGNREVETAALRDGLAVAEEGRRGEGG